MSVPRSATRVGSGYGEVRKLDDIAETPVADPNQPPIPAVPTPPAAAVLEEWRDTPWMVGQQHKHPASVRVGGMIAKVFVLSNSDQLAEYNAITAKARLHDPGVIISNNLVHPSTKHDGFIVFLQYRTVEYKNVVPEKERKAGEINGSN